MWFKNKANGKEIVKKIESNQLFKRYILLVIGISIAAAGFNLFFFQFNLVCFGVSGFSIIVEKVFSIDPSIFILISSIILLIMSFFMLGWDKTKNSIVGSLMFPIFVKLTSGIITVIDISHIEMIMVAIFGGVISGFGYGLVYKTGFTTGGTDILNQIISKYFKLSVGNAIIIVDGLVMLTGLFVFGEEIAMYGMISLYIISMMTDKVILGISESKFFHIVTYKQDEVHDYLVNTIGAGVTILEGKGGFSGDDTKILMCIIPTRRYFLVKQGIKQIDDRAFFVVTDAYEVGNLKKAKRRKNEKIKSL